MIKSNNPHLAGGEEEEEVEVQDQDLGFLEKFCWPIDHPMFL